MYNNNVGGQPGVATNPFGNTFYGAGSGLIRGGLGAYGEKILGSSFEYVQSNISRYFSDPQYYFQVNDQYVRNKLKVVLFPFLHRGHWTRITELVGGRLSYKPPIYDINAPDLYIPLMAFGTYVVLAGFSLGRHGKFSLEALNWLFIKGLLGWFAQVMILKVMLFSLGSGEAPLLDIVAYAGYTFPGLCLAVLGRIMWSYSYYLLLLWTCLCMGVFLVKIMKRALFAEAVCCILMQRCQVRFLGGRRSTRNYSSTGNQLRTVYGRLESDLQSSRKRHVELAEQCNALKKGREESIQTCFHHQ